MWIMRREKGAGSREQGAGSREHEEEKIRILHKNERSETEKDIEEWVRQSKNKRTSNCRERDEGEREIEMVTKTYLKR